MQKLIYTALFIMGVFAVVVTPVSALTITQTQKQKAEQEMECEPGLRTTTTTIDSYGKTTETKDEPGKCKGSQSIEQEQQQKILGEQVVYNEQRIHYPTDTALDGNTMASVIGLATIGGLSYAAKKKLA